MSKNGIELTCQNCGEKQSFLSSLKAEEAGWTAIKIGKDLPDEISPKQRDWYCSKEACQDALVIDTIEEVFGQGEDLDSELIKGLEKKKKELVE